MALLELVVLAALEGLTEGLPLSGSGHAAVASLWTGPVRDLGAVLHLGTALGLAVAVRRRLAATTAEGARAVARPALFQASPVAREAGALVVGAAVSLAVRALVEPLVVPWRASPFVAGAGLLATGLALASTLLAPRPAALRSQRGLSFLAAGLVGVAHGIAVFPGASPVGAALTLLIWLGVRPLRAMELAFLLTIPTLLFSFVRGLGAASGLPWGALAAAELFAFLGTLVAVSALTALAERRRVGALALYAIPLALAMLAYARALPHGS